MRFVQFTENMRSPANYAVKTLVYFVEKGCQFGFIGKGVFSGVSTEPFQLDFIFVIFW